MLFTLLSSVFSFNSYSALQYSSYIDLMVNVDGKRYFALFGEGNILSLI